MTTIELAGRKQLYEELLREVSELRQSMLNLEKEILSREGQIPAEEVERVRNLAHYLALRQKDRRPLQEKLASVGLSSLGRSESHVLATVDSVLSILVELTGSREGFTPSSSVGFEEGRAILKRNAELVLGPGSKDREVRIMVTMPTEAATDYPLVRGLVKEGMDIMRINCAHDDSSVWARMIENLRRAEAEVGRRCLVEMDIPGPKVRTGPIQMGPKVKKIRPTRDSLGQVTSAARVCLTRDPVHGSDPNADFVIPIVDVSGASPRPGEKIRFEDARGAGRSLSVVSVEGANIYTELSKTAYFKTGAVLHLRGREDPESMFAAVGELPPLPIPIYLRKGDYLTLTRSRDPGRSASYNPDGSLRESARISCAVPEVVDSIKAHDPAWFDDGKFGGVVERVDEDGALVRITVAPPDGVSLGADKGINLPETDLQLPPISKEDDEALAFIAQHADLVGQSFVRRAGDVSLLQSKLMELGGGSIGIILKVETRQAFEGLPSLLLALIKSNKCGVMIARGDLAVECGWERLAEVQEEILWVCEAAHIPVVWATQVLETLTKTGLPSRAEITDAAFSEGAECVMLNKGPHVIEAVKSLDDILKRMQSHQEKKSPMMRRLRIADNFGPA